MKFQKLSLYCIFLEDIAVQTSSYLPERIGKAFIDGFLFLSLLFFIISLTKKDIKLKANYSKRFLYLVGILGLLSIISIFKTIFNTSDPLLDSLGNRYLSLFFNPMCAPYIVAPVFVLGYTLINRLYVKTSILLLVISAFTMQSFEILCVLPFLPYFKMSPAKRNIINIFIVIVLITCIYVAIVPNKEDNTSRVFAIVFMIAVSAILYYYLMKRNKSLLYLYFSLVLVFVIVSVYMGINGDSIFENVMSAIGTENNKVDSTDTRSFLYIELIDDLINTNSLWLGKGAYSHYFSYFFLSSNSGNGDFYERIGTEVYWLNFIQKSGLIYFFILAAIYVKGIFNAIKKGKSTFMRIIAVILVGWFLLGFISFTGTVEFADITMYVFLGLCHSKYWLNKTDSEIKELLSKRKPKRIWNNYAD